MQAAAGGMWAAAVVTVLVATFATATMIQGGLRGCDSRMSAQATPEGDEAQVIARAARRIELGPGRIDVTLDPVDGMAGLAKRLDTLPANAKVILVVRELSADQQPGTQFRVYFELPEGRTPTDADPHEVGRIAFFNEVRAGREDAPTSWRSYDITQVVRTVQALGMIQGPLTVSIIPQRPPAADAKAVVGEIELIVR